MLAISIILPADDIHTLTPHDFLKGKILHLNFGGGVFRRPGPSQPPMVNYLQLEPQIIGF